MAALPAILEDNAVDEPLILAAICADELINVFPNSDSAVVILPAKLDEVAVNEPLIVADV